jgi:hypothetical protein
MRFSLAGTALVVLVAFGSQLSAHHSTVGYFDVSKAMTLEGQIARMEWVNPHILLFVEAKNARGEAETWVVQGYAPNAAVRGGLQKERFQRGMTVTVRVHPPRSGLVVNNLTVLQSGGEASTSPHIVEAGELRFPNGDVQTFGRGPGFSSR